MPLPPQGRPQVDVEWQLQHGAQSASSLLVHGPPPRSWLTGARESGITARVRPRGGVRAWSQVSSPGSAIDVWSGRSARPGGDAVQLTDTDLRAALERSFGDRHTGHAHFWDRAALS